MYNLRMIFLFDMVFCLICCVVAESPDRQGSPVMGGQLFGQTYHLRLQLRLHTLYAHGLVASSPSDFQGLTLHLLSITLWTHLNAIFIMDYITF